MLGNHFLVPGHEYKVITHRPNTLHSCHFFESGTEVVCIKVAAVGRQVDTKGVSRDFKRPHIAGLFVDDKGVDQLLYTGDVKKCPR